MATITLVEDIGAPAAAVRRLALDIEGSSGMFPQITKVEMLASPKDGEGLAGVGTRWRETRRAGLGSATVELEVTERDPDGSFVVSCGVMGARIETRFTFTPTGAGRCRVTLGATITPGGWWSRVMSGVMTWAMSKGLREDLASLKRAAEAGAG